MSIRLQGVLVAAAGLAVSLPAAAQSIPWLTATTGNWSDAARWTGGNVPNAAGESAVLGLSGGYTVTQNVGGLTLDAVSITNVDAVLNLSNNAITLLGTGIANAGTIVNNTGVGSINGPMLNLAAGRVNVNNATTMLLLSNVTNDGLMTVNATSGGSATALRIEAPLTIDGTGDIVLNRPANQAQLAVSGVGLLTLGDDQTVRGQGQITGLFTNNGTVQADVASTTLNLSVGAKTNNGVMRAAGGTLEINGITVTQGASGEIRGDGSFVTMIVGGISGGNIASSSGGGVRSASGVNTLTSVDSTALVQVGNVTILALAGGNFTNDGTIDVNYNAGGSVTTLRIDGPLTIDGTGEIIMRRPANQSQITAGVDGSLVLGAGQVVRGQGQISVGTTNNGVIQADSPATTLLIHSAAKINNNLMRAFGGTLNFSGVTVTNSATGEIHADGTNVTMLNSTINGGTLRSLGGGVIQQTSGLTTLSNVDSHADVQVFNASTLALMGGSYTNNGTLLVNPTTGGSSSAIRIDDDLTIDGTGEIVLNAPAGRAQIIPNGASGSLTLGVGQTVRGFGQISAPTTNNGLIEADVAAQTLLLNSNNKVNNGVIRASGGTVGAVSITITQNAAGLIHANGSNVDLNNTTIVGGTVRASGGGILRQISGLSTLDSVALEGPAEVINGFTLAVKNALTNDGTITVNPSAGGSGTTLRISGAATIGGTGQIILNSTSSRAQILPDGDATLALGPGQTLRGIGQIGLSMSNEGTIAPGLSIGTLVIMDPSRVTTWATTSSLDVELGSAVSFDKITGGSNTINGGTVNVTLVGGYTPALFTPHTIIDGTSGSVVTGKFDSVTGPALPEPWVWKVGYTANDVLVGVSCPSDVNADFIVDIVDFLDFLDSFGSCENQPAPCGTVVDADYNGDTFVDILDFLDFFDAFGSGC